MFGLFEGGNTIGGAYKSGGGDTLRAIVILIVMFAFLALVFWLVKKIVVGVIKLAKRDYTLK